jgi:hypothetical protein
VLVVDRVEQPVVEQAQQVRELHADRPSGLEDEFQARDEVLHVRDVRQDVVADQQVGHPPFAGEPGRGRRAEEARLGRDALAPSLGGDVRRGLMPSTGTPRCAKPQQVAVVARDFDDEAVGPERCSITIRLASAWACASQDAENDEK